VTPASVLDHHALGYAYDSEPTPLAVLTERFSARRAALGRVRLPPRTRPVIFDLSPEDKRRG